MSYVIFGRAIKNEYLALATLGATGLIASMAMGGGKKAEAAPANASLAQVKESVKINASSSEEEELMNSIKKFIADAEKEAGSGSSH